MKRCVIHDGEEVSLVVDSLSLLPIISER